MTVEEVDVGGWAALDVEPMGEPGKLWLVDPAGDQWLWKPAGIQHDGRRGDFPRGEDWAEVIASAAATAIGLPAALVLPASRDGRPGALSRDISDGRRLVHGNELIYALDSTYPAQKGGTVPGYRLERILDALEASGVEGPACADAPPQTAASVFAGYLVLDAWIANQDRHHQNWGVLDDQRGAAAPILAPTFDHGSSLGFSLHDDDKHRRLAGGQVEQWAGKGVCRPMENQPRLVDLASQAVHVAGAPARHWIDRLARLSPEQQSSLLDAPPEARMSQVSRRFARAVMTTNRRRLLDGA
ncbi:MAG: hypothetical protein M0Z30_10810 [Actinomycetota bacterium]|nr:hypothetical protein [Actinomycetota bacterium]